MARRGKRDRSRAGEWNAGIAKLRQGLGEVQQIYREFRAVIQQIRGAKAEFRREIDEANVQQLAARRQNDEVARTIRARRLELDDLGKAEERFVERLKAIASNPVRAASAVRAGATATAAAAAGNVGDAASVAGAGILRTLGGAVVPHAAIAALVLTQVREIIERHIEAEQEKLVAEIRLDLHERVARIVDTYDLAARFEGDARFRDAVTSAGFAKLRAEEDSSGKTWHRGGELGGGE